MPHLVELQSKHEKDGLTVLAVAVKDEPKAVSAFVAKRKEALNHPIATDTPEGKDAGFMAKEWLEKAGREGIPQTFIVDRKGRIAWIGHPMRVDGPLAAVLKGTFDPRQQEQMDKAFAKLDAKLGEMIRETRWRDVLAVLDEMNQVDPASAPLNYSTRVKALIQVGQAAAANHFAREVAPGVSEMIAAHIASELLKVPDKEQTDYDLVIRLAQQALKNGGFRNPMALSALARAYEGHGKTDDAVRVWRQMLALDDPSIDKENIRKRLGEQERTPTVAVQPFVESRLKVGDPSPGFQGSGFLQGERVGQVENGKAYLVDFWATWCGPCIDSIPHLQSLHQKYKAKGLVVIGQDVWENDPSKVKAFIEKTGDEMTYRIALDDAKGTMAEHWLKAAGLKGIPTAFLVGKDGKVAWIGHPMGLDEDLIEQVLAGSYDLSKAAMDYQNQQVADKKSERFYELIRAKKWNEAEAVLNEVISLTGAKEEEVASGRLMVLTGRGDFDAAAALAERYCQHEKVKDNADALNQIAHQLLQNEIVKGKALALACQFATRANELRHGEDANILGTLARAVFMQGDKERAIALQQKAINLTDNSKVKEQLQHTLQNYKAGKLPSAK